MTISTRMQLVFILALLAGAAGVHAQSPREQMNQMIQLLQRTPNDKSLREKIIKLALEIKPPPAVPEEAERRLARGETAFERAKDPSDYANAVREFQAAVAAAPWLATPYFNLGVTEEKADHPKEAMESFRWYLLAAPEARDAAEVRKRLFKLEYAAEQLSTAGVASAKEAATREQEKRISGTWKRPHALSDGKPRLEILYVRQISGSRWTILKDYYLGGERVVKEAPFGGPDQAYAVVGGEIRFKLVTPSFDLAGVCATYEVTGTVSPDGNTLNLAYTLMPFAPDRPEAQCPLRRSHTSEVIAYKR